MISMFLTLPWKKMGFAFSLAYQSVDCLHFLFSNVEQQPMKINLDKNVLF